MSPYNSPNGANFYYRKYPPDPASAFCVVFKFINFICSRLFSEIFLNSRKFINLRFGLFTGKYYKNTYIYFFKLQKINNT